MLCRQLRSHSQVHALGVLAAQAATALNCKPLLLLLTCCSPPAPGGIAPLAPAAPPQLACWRLATVPGQAQVIALVVAAAAATSLCSTVLMSYSKRHSCAEAEEHKERRCCRRGLGDTPCSTASLGARGGHTQDRAAR